MEKTIVVTVDYKLNRFAWDDQIGYSGGQPFGNSTSNTFDTVYDLLKLMGYGDIIFNIEREEIKEHLNLLDLVSREEIESILGKQHDNFLKHLNGVLDRFKEEKKGYSVGDKITFKRPDQNFNGCDVDASRAVGVIREIHDEDYIIEFENESFFPLSLRDKGTWSINKYLVRKC